MTNLTALILAMARQLVAMLSYVCHNFRLPFNAEATAKQAQFRHTSFLTPNSFNNPGIIFFPPSIINVLLLGSVYPPAHNDLSAAGEVCSNWISQHGDVEQSRLAESHL